MLCAYKYNRLIVGGYIVGLFCHCGVKIHLAMGSADTLDNQLNPQTQSLTVSCKILRSPSHESVTTDLSLFSVSSSAASEINSVKRLLSFSIRGHSPNPESRNTSSSR